MIADAALGPDWLTWGGTPRPKMRAAARGSRGFIQRRARHYRGNRTGRSPGIH